MKASERQTILFPVSLRLLAWNPTISFQKASERHFLLLVLCGLCCLYVPTWQLTLWKISTAACGRGIHKARVEMISNKTASDRRNNLLGACLCCGQTTLQAFWEQAKITIPWPETTASHMNLPAHLSQLQTSLKHFRILFPNAPLADRNVNIVPFSE